MHYLHTSISTGGTDQRDHHNARVLDSLGHQVFLENCHDVKVCNTSVCDYPLFYATPSNSYGSVLRAYVDKVLALGFKGLYHDEFGATDVMFNYDGPWDNASVIMDGETKAVIATPSCLWLLTQDTEIALFKHIVSRGGSMIANGAPATLTWYKLRPASMHFAENSMAHRALATQVYTPIMLSKPFFQGGDADPLYDTPSDRRLCTSVLQHLDFGVLTFGYDGLFPNASATGRHESVYEKSFPITVQELGRGFVVGKERAITKVNNSLFNNSAAESSTVYLYDECDLVWQKAERSHVAVTLMPRQIAIIVWKFAAVKTDDDLGQRDTTARLQHGMLTAATLPTLLTLDWQRLPDVPAQGRGFAGGIAGSKFYGHGFQNSDGGWLTQDIVVTAFGHGGGTFMSSGWLINVTAALALGCRGRPNCSDASWQQLPPAPVVATQTILNGGDQRFVPCADAHCTDPARNQGRPPPPPAELNSAVGYCKIPGKTDDTVRQAPENETLLGSYGYWLTGSSPVPATVSDIAATISAFQETGQTLMGVPVDQCHYWALLRPALEATAHTEIKVFGVLGSHNGPIYCPAVWGNTSDGKPIASGVGLNWTLVSTTLATLSIEFPHFIGFTIDDFYCMMQNPLNPSTDKKVTVAEMAHAHISMKTIAPSFVFMPTVYPPYMGTFAAERGFTLGVGPEIPFDVNTSASVSFQLSAATAHDSRPNSNDDSVAFWISSPFVTWGDHGALPNPVWRNKMYVRCVIRRADDSVGTVLLDLDLYDLASCPSNSAFVRQCMPGMMTLVNVSLPKANHSWSSLTVEIYARDAVNLNFYSSKLASVWDVSLSIDGHEQIDSSLVQFHTVDSPTGIYNNISNVGKVKAHANTEYSIARACDGLLFPTPMSVLALAKSSYKSLIQHAIDAMHSRGLRLWTDHYQWMWPGVFGKSVANAEPAFLKWMIEADREASVAAVVFCGLRLEVSNLPSQRGIFKQRQAPNSSKRVALMQNWSGVAQGWFPGFVPGYGGWYQSWTSREPLELDGGALTVGVSRGRILAAANSPWYFSAIIRELDGPVLFNASADAAPLASSGSSPCPGMDRVAAVARGLNCTVRFPQLLSATDFPEVVDIRAAQPLQLVLEMSELQGVGNHPSGVMFATTSAVDDESVWHYDSGIRDATLLESYQAVVAGFLTAKTDDDQTAFIVTAVVDTKPILTFPTNSAWQQVFNPTWVAPSPATGNRSGLLVRSQNCTPTKPDVLDGCVGCSGTGQRASWLTWAELENDAGSDTLPPRTVHATYSDSVCLDVGCHTLTYGSKGSSVAAAAKKLEALCDKTKGCTAFNADVQGGGCLRACQASAIIRYNVTGAGCCSYFRIGPLADTLRWKSDDVAAPCSCDPTGQLCKSSPRSLHTNAK
jgi:hypothetical protein